MNHQQRRVYKAKVRKEIKALQHLGVDKNVLNVMRDLSLAQAKSDKPIVEEEKCQIQKKDHSLLNKLMEPKEEVILKL